MKYLKYPKKKSRDKSIDYVQDTFSRMIRDIPASECPKDAVVDAVNAFLFGDRFKARPGTIEWSPATVPQFAVITSVTKTGSTVSCAENFDSTYIGKYISFSDGLDQIIEISGTDAIVDNSTARANGSYVVYSPVNGIKWHKKSQKIFVHVDTDLYYSTYEALVWTKVNPSIGSLSNTKSTMDEFQDYLYIFNANGHFRVDTDESPYSMVQINTTQPDNSIVHDESTIETEDFRFARRYLFGMSKIAGTGVFRDRLDSKVIKETGTNPIDPDAEYTDYKEIWFRIQAGDNIQETAGGRALYVAGTDVANWIGVKLVWTQEVTHVVDGTRTELVVADCTNAKEWFDVCDAITDGLRSAFPEYPAIYCAYRANSQYIVLQPGQTDLTVGLTSAPNTTFGTDATAQANIHWWSSSADRTIELALPGYIDIGTINNPSLVPPEAGWTHYSLYTTKYFSTKDEKFSLINANQYIWNKDIRVIGFIKGTINSSGALTVTDGSLEDADAGCQIYTEDGMTFNIKEVNSATSATVVCKGDNVADRWMAIGASDIRRGSASGVTLTIDALLSGTQTSYNANKLTDSGATFVADGITKDDYVWNIDDDTVAQVGRISRGVCANRLSYFLDDLQATFVSDGVTINDKVDLPALGWSSTVSAINSETQILQGNYFPDFDYEYVVYEPNSETQLTLDSDIFSTGNDNYQIHRGRFTSADVGKTVYWEDGTTNIIIGYVNPFTVTLDESVIKSGMGFSLTPIGREFSDTISDELLTNRQEDWPLIQRFWDALPSGELGEVGGGFMSVAPRLDEKAYYSQFNFEIIYLAGHYRSDYQFLEFKDRLIEIQEMPNQIIYWCANSTWRTQTNVINTIEDPRISESIAIQSGQSVVDGFVGAMDRTGIVDIGIGHKIIITSEPGIRTFDGYRYSDNMAIDEKGRGLILKDLQKMRHRFIAIYEPNLYGFIFWSNTDSIVMDDGSEISKTDVCYRLALRAEQGFGFSEIQGDDWIWPNLGGGPLLVTDDKEEQFIIIFDYKTGKPYRLSTRESSAISARTMSWKDKDSTEIAWNVDMVEHIAPDEEKKLRFLEQYFNFRPHDEANKNASGYTPDGFRDALELRIDAHLNGNTSADAEVNSNNDDTAALFGVNQTRTVKCNLAYPYKVTGNRVQHRISGTASEVECVKYRVLYDELDVAPNPTLVTGERNWQRQFAAPVFWISRGRDKQINLATNKSPDTMGLNRNAVAGPDGNTYSAWSLQANGSEDDVFTWNSIASSRFTTIMFWMDLPDAGDDVGTEYTEEAVGQVYTDFIKFIISETRINFYIQDVLAGSHIFSETRDTVFVVIKITNLNIISTLYDTTGAVLETNTIVVNVSGFPTVNISVSGSGAKLYDLRKYNRSNSSDNDYMSDDAILYWIRDIVEYDGFSLLPEYVNTDTGAPPT